MKTGILNGYFKVDEVETREGLDLYAKLSEETKDKIIDLVESSLPEVKKPVWVVNKHGRFNLQASYSIAVQEMKANLQKLKGEEDD